MRNIWRSKTVRVIAFLAWATLGYIVANAFMWMVVFVAPPDIMQDTSPVVLTAVLSTIMYVVALFLIVGGVYWRKKWKKETLMSRLGMARWPKLSDVGLGMIGYVPYYAGSLLFIAFLLIVFPGFDIEQEQQLGFDTLATQGELIIAFISLVVVAPLAEEVLFRGFIFGTLRRYVSFTLTTLIVSVLFGAVHGQLNVAVDTFILSIIMCMIREYSGAIWAPLVLHMIKNGVAFTLLFVVI